MNLHCPSLSLSLSLFLLSLPKVALHADDMSEPEGTLFKVLISSEVLISFIFEIYGTFYNKTRFVVYIIKRL